LPVEITEKKVSIYSACTTFQFQPEWKSCWKQQHRDIFQSALYEITKQNYITMALFQEGD